MGEHIITIQYWQLPTYNIFKTVFLFLLTYSPSCSNIYMIGLAAGLSDGSEIKIQDEETSTHPFQRQMRANNNKERNKAC